MVSIATFALLLVAGFSATEVYSATQTTIKDNPSIVLLESGYSCAWLQTCVGSIVTSRHVLTAAHCLIAAVIEPRFSRVRAGTDERGRGGEIIEVESAIRHPSYTFRSFDSNVGLLRLESPLVFGSTIQQIAIAAPGVVFPANVAVTLTGWGRTGQDVIWADRDLYSTELYTTDHSDCVAKYASLRVPITVTDNMICATIPGEAGINVGLRDGGAPIQYDGVLIGFTSFGSPISKNYPLVMTSISSFTPWIVENTAQ